jgi:hypothetical protein
MSTVAVSEPEAPVGRKPKTVLVEPVELPSAPVGEMEVASPLEFIDSEAQPSWTQRGIEVDFSSQDSGATGADDFGAPGEVPLASVLDFVPSWDPTAEREAEGARSGNGASEGPLVRLPEALDALKQATTRSQLGLALLSYIQGRFPRGFLLGETFGLARVGRAYGPGSDKPEVAVLQVDLDAPSLLAVAAAQGKPIVSSVPESQEDEVLFAALGESFSHLLAASIRLHQSVVGFVVIDGGPSPFGAEELEELEQLTAAASEAYSRLHGSAS